MKKLMIPILILALLLTAGCASASEEAAQDPAAEETAAVPAAEEAAPPAAENAVFVSSLDELIAAVAPGATIELAEGSYTLTPPETAGDVTDYCRWIDLYDGFELEIHDADDLTIRGAGMGKTTISARPRYANVLTFTDCDRLTVEELSAGHTEEPGACSGGVLFLRSCRNAAVSSCSLYGCGTVGVSAQDCAGLTVRGTSIYECSYDAVSVWDCSVVHVYDCDVYSCGSDTDMPAFGLFDANNTDVFSVSGCRIRDNAAQSLITAGSSNNVKFLSNDVSGCRFDGPVFDLYRCTAAVDGCSLVHNSYLQWAGALRPVDAEGSVLSDEALEEMTLREIDPAEVSVKSPVISATEVEPGGEIRVTTVDEFLSAIGPERTVILAPGVYDLSAATGFGGYGGEYYTWEQTYDGPQLTVSGVYQLFIRAESEEPRDTVITAAPRYANVLAFKDCSAVGLTGFTAGHSDGTGECTGGVIDLVDCTSVVIDRCRLYGCGVSGVGAWQCSSIVVRSSEIFECSWCAAYLSNCDVVSFYDCVIRDIPSPALQFDSCSDVLWNGSTVTNGMYDVSGGALVSYGGQDDGSNRAGTAFREDSPELAFALKAQAVFALGDWEELAKMANYPLRIYTASGTYVFDGPESMRAELLGELLPGDFRRTVSCASLFEYRQTAYGSVFADGALAFEHFATAGGQELRLTAISTTWGLYL